MIFRSIPQWYMGNRTCKGTRLRANREVAIFYNPLSHHTSLCSSPSVFSLIHKMQAVISRMAAASDEGDTSPWKTAALPSGITGDPWELAAGWVGAAPVDSRSTYDIPGYVIGGTALY